jgi:hypothetical protein
MSNIFRATTPADFEQIAELGTRAFEIEPANPFYDRDYQHWKYWKPHPDWDGSRSYVIDRDGKMAAHGCTWPMRFETVSRQWRGQYLIDWAADASTAGVGILLLRRTAALVDGVCAIGGSAMTRAIMPKIGFRPFNAMWFMVRPLHPLLQIRTHQFRNWKLPLRLARNTMWRYWPPIPAAPGWAVVNCAPEDIPESLWPQPAGSSVVCGRSAGQFDFLLQCPAVRFSFHGLSRQGKLAGYFCLAVTQRQVRIVDLWTPSNTIEDWTAAYAGALRTALRVPGAAEAVTASSFPLGQQALLHCGFRVLETAPVSLYGSKEFLSCGESFHIQMVDSDFSFVHGNRTEYSS